MRSRRLDSGFGRLDLSLGYNVSLDGIVIVLLRDGFLLRQRRVLVYIELSLDLVSLCLGKLCLGLQQLTVGLRDLRLRLRDLRIGLLKLSLILRHLAVGLVQRGLKWPRINLKQQLPLPYKRAFLVILSE